MSADELRRAAAKARELAEAATPGPWRFNSSMEDSLHSDAAGWVGHDRTGDGFQEYVCGTSNHPDGFADGAYIAAMSPAVGLALADWLDDLHGRITDTDYDEDDELAAALRGNADVTDWPEVHRALAVARAILCAWCTVCPACTLGIHSCCNPVACKDNGLHHRCACPDGRHQAVKR